MVMEELGFKWTKDENGDFVYKLKDEQHLRVTPEQFWQLCEFLKLPEMRLQTKIVTAGEVVEHLQAILLEDMDGVFHPFDDLAVTTQNSFIDAFGKIWAAALGEDKNDS